MNCSRGAGGCCFLDGLAPVIPDLFPQYQDDSLFVLVEYAGRGEYALACSDADISVCGDVHCGLLFTR